jgi:acetyl-CoA/propionyl-CoA carboxylase biotin carboxyl carrier protein
VTEQVVGVDLVRAQLLVAAGQPLPWRADQLRQRGHAIECRVYAEHPAEGFLPQSGPLLLYREPAGPGVRVDSGYREGDSVSVHYDPLVAKLIVSAESRALALARLDRALSEFAVLGIHTNVPFLRALVNHPDVRAGRLDTRFIERTLDELVADAHLDALPEEVAAAALLAAAAPASQRMSAVDRPDPWRSLTGWRN